MARLDKKAYSALKRKYNVDTIYSWSRISTYVEHPWEYYLKYIKRVPLNTTNVYNFFGTHAHDIVQDYILGKYEQNNMIKLFDDVVDDWFLNDKSLTFPEKEGSTSVQDGYINNLQHYFKYTHYDFSDTEVDIEKPVRIVLNDGKGNIVYVGYIDLLYKRNGKTYIQDFKTSSKSGFSGKQLDDASKQLKLYAIGIHQQFGIPYEDIVLRYDMQKYVTVSRLQKNGKWSKPSAKERQNWGESLANFILKCLEDDGYDIIEAMEMIEHLPSAETIDDLPEPVRDKIKIEPYFIDINMTEDMANEMIEWTINNTRELEDKLLLDDLESVFPEPNLEIEDSFYYQVLAKDCLRYHKGYQESLKSQEMFEKTLSGDDLFDDSSSDTVDISNLFD